MKFEISARGYMSPGGQTIRSGDTYTVNVNMSGVHPNTVLSDSKAANAIRQQLSAQGLKLPPSGYLSYNQWNVKHV